MFSQRNNPYCDLLKFDVAKVGIKTETTKFFDEKVAFEARKDVFSASGLLPMSKNGALLQLRLCLKRMGYPKRHSE